MRSAERFAQEARAAGAITPRQIGRFADADARARHDVQGLRAGQQLKRWAVEGKPVVQARDAESLAQPSRSRAEEPLIAGAPPPAHRRKPVGGRECPNEDRTGRAFRLANEVETPVDAVGAI